LLGKAYTYLSKAPLWSNAGDHLDDALGSRGVL